MMTRSLSLAAALALTLVASGAQAQTAPATAPAVPAKSGAKPRTAQSLECSKKADAANIHGKPRKAFMSKCKAGKA